MSVIVLQKIKLHYFSQTIGPKTRRPSVKYAKDQPTDQPHSSSYSRVHATEKSGLICFGPPFADDYLKKVVLINDVQSVKFPKVIYDVWNKTKENHSNIFCSPLFSCGHATL